MTQKAPNPWTFDVRVRERNLKNGQLTEKDLEKHLAALPDVADQSEPFGTSQPALAAADIDEDDDDEEEEQDGEAQG